MKHQSFINRRTLLKTGAATAATIVSPGAFAAYKAPGEVRAVFLGGDFYHNSVTQEQTWRRVFDVTDWRLMFVQDAAFITPELLATADLFVLTRYMTDTQTTNFSLGFSPDQIVEIGLARQTNANTLRASHYSSRKRKRMIRSYRSPAF